jgi:CGNR zinc finger protein
VPTCPYLSVIIGSIRLDGNRLCLDFVNTIHDRYAHDLEDYLSSDTRFLEWSAHASALSHAELPLKRVALSALDLLQKDHPRRFKRCAGRSACGWLFYDASKPNRRRWCSMEVCGIEHKVLLTRNGGQGISRMRCQPVWVSSGGCTRDNSRTSPAITMRPLMKRAWIVMS